MLTHGGSVGAIQRPTDPYGRITGSRSLWPDPASADTMREVSVPLIPAPLPELARRPFEFHPPIVGVPHNEWVLQRSSWTELLVINTLTGEQILVPTRYVAEIRYHEDGSQTVALLEPVEYKHGRVLPVRRGVLEMRTAREALAPGRNRASGRPAAVVAIKLEPRTESFVKRALRGSIALGFLACLAVIFVIRDAHLGARLGISSIVTRPLPLGAGDDYFAVVNKLGRPGSDRWMERAAGGGYRRLWYPRRRMAVILSGETKDSAHYVRTLGRDGTTIHAAAPSILDELSLTPAWR